MGSENGKKLSWETARNWLLAATAGTALFFSVKDRIWMEAQTTTSQRVSITQLERTVTKNTAAIEDLSIVLQDVLRHEERIQAIEGRIDRQDRRFDRTQTWLAQQLEQTNERLSTAISLLKESR